MAAQAKAIPIYKPEQIADWFLLNVDREKGDLITHLKLQKLVYYAQAWSLALFDRPLFEEDFQAWMHGPVLPSLYHRHKDYKYEPLPAPEGAVDLDPDTEALLTDLLNTYGEKSAKALEELTHQEEPWIRARGGLSIEEYCREIIPKDHMKEFYRRLYDEVDNE